MMMPKGQKEPIESKRGLLWKRGDDLVKKWKLRFFILTAGKMVYYEDENKQLNNGEASGFFVVRNAQVREYQQNLYGRPYTFGVTPHDSNRTFILSAETILQRAQWMHVLRAHGACTWPLLKEGYIEKAGAAGPSKGYSKRYFILYGDRISYYKAPTDTSAKQSLVIQPNTIAETFNDKPGHFRFIPKPKVRIYHLISPTSEEAQIWIDAINNAAFNREYNKPRSGSGSSRLLYFPRNSGYSGQNQDSTQSEHKPRISIEEDNGGSNGGGGSGGGVGGGSGSGSGSGSCSGSIGSGSPGDGGRISRAGSTSGASMSTVNESEPLERGEKRSSLWNLGKSLVKNALKTPEHSANSSTNNSPLADPLTPEPSVMDGTLKLPSAISEEDESPRVSGVRTPEQEGTTEPDFLTPTMKQDCLQRGSTDKSKKKLSIYQRLRLGDGKGDPVPPKPKPDGSPPKEVSPKKRKDRKYSSDSGSILAKIRGGRGSTKGNKSKPMIVFEAPLITLRAKGDNLAKKHRFVRLQPDCILVYKSSELAAQGKTAYSIGLLYDTNVSPKQVPGMANTFSVHSPHKEFVFMAPNELAMNVWMGYITQHIPQKIQQGTLFCYDRRTMVDCVVLTDRILLTSHKDDWKASLELTHVSEVMALDVPLSHERGSLKKENVHPGTFALEAMDGLAKKRLVLLAETEWDRIHWIDCINQQIPTVVRQGYLEKAVRGIPSKGFKSRFVMVLTDRLLYFKTRGATQPAGMIRYSTDTRLSTTNNATKKNTFALITQPGGRIFHFAAENAIDRIHWMQAISERLPGKFRGVITALQARAQLFEPSVTTNLAAIDDQSDDYELDKSDDDDECSDEPASA